MPQKTSGSGKTALYTLLMGISSRTKQERLAWEFLKELCYDLETQSQIPESDSGLPVIREAVEQIQAEDTNMEVALDTKLLKLQREINNLLKNETR